MAFGYNLLISPLQTLTLYNAIANQGKMMRPYLVSAIREEGVLIKEINPVTVHESVCSNQTLGLLKSCLEGVCTQGTAKDLFKNSLYPVAGKTGTALIANNNKGYADKIYQSSFAGYFPANNPQYTCVVVIKNKPHAPVFYGAAVAGPVFKEIADRLYSTYVKQGIAPQPIAQKNDSTTLSYSGSKKEMVRVLSALHIPFKDSSLNAQWASVNGNTKYVTTTANTIDARIMPTLKGMGLKDAVYLCENMGLRLSVKGKGKVMAQSIVAGQAINKGTIVALELN
jgi:cell division protein FtsI (penicillin-binding protein 3)